MKDMKLSLNEEASMENRKRVFFFGGGGGGGRIKREWEIK